MEHEKVWVVSGANGGIGPATIQYLLLRGQTVVAIPAEKEDQQGEISFFKQVFPMADIRLTNIFHAPDTETTVRDIIDQYGRIDNLINIGDAGLLSLYVLTAMKKAGHGHIIQFVDEGKRNETQLDVRQDLQSICSSRKTVLYTLIKPDLFFQSILH